MSRKLPEELVPVLARTGRQWPRADEEGLRKAAGVWRGFGQEADRLTRLGGESVRRVTADNSGHAVEAFGAYWQGFSGGGKGHLDDAHSAVGLVAGAFDTAARAVDTCKAEIITTLRQLAADLRQAEELAAGAREAAGRVAASADAGRADSGVVGGLEKAVGGFASKVRNAATEQVAAGMAAVAVEAAGLKIGGLLAELGRAMKDALAGVLKEPAAVALLKLGTARGTRVTAASYRNGAFDPLAAGLPVALGEPGVLGADGSGLVLLAGKDGRQLVGVPGLAVKVDEHGAPVLGPDGRPVILRADGTPVADASGLLVVPGPDGKPVVGVADPAVRLDEHGRPVLTDEAGRAVHGVPLSGPAPGADGPDTDRRGVGVTADGPGDPRTPGVVTVASVAVADPGAAVGGPEAAVAASAPGGAGAGAVASGGVTAGASYAASYAPAGGSPVSHPAAGGGGGGGGGDRTPPVRSVAASARQGGGVAGWSDGDYPLQAPAPAASPSHGGGGSVTVRTDSVSAPAAPVAPVVSAPSVGAPAHGPAPEAPVTVRPVGVSGQFGTPGYGGGYQPAGPVGVVGPGPLAGAGAGPANVAAPFGSGVGAGAGGVVGGGVVGGGPAGGGSGGGGPVGGAPMVRTPAGVAPSPMVGPPPVHGAPPPPAAPPIVGTTPVIGRPEAHPAEPRRRETAPGPADPTLAWGAVPVATAHAMALQLALRARRGALPDDPAVRARSIADSRPYGLPGGLGPVDPEHQAELERRAPRDEGGLPARHPDPAAGGWAEAVDDGGYREPGRANNSLEIALSAVECYTGRPTCAAPRIPTEGDAGERGGRDRAERELGAPFRDLGDGGRAFDRLADGLRRAGHGSQAVLLTLDAYGRPHAWNAVNHRDAVTYLDHQLARQAATPLHPATHGLWAIALTPEGRPLDLTSAA
ncbi:toxin glutamine deamidase domain-containing protein [Kitasatospora sp. NPDC056783]|uniref:toxin glutamine deamidase domain-containing protein n=1 Tax=Kitasatospora sp. NPDC056783 TaxID=3345943 RepID=UPI0036860ACA